MVKIDFAFEIFPVFEFKMRWFNKKIVSQKLYAY